MADTQTTAPADFLEQARHYRAQGGDRAQLISYLQQCGCDSAAAMQWADRFDFDLGMTGASLPADTSPHIVELVIAHRAAANPAPAPITSPPATAAPATAPPAAAAPSMDAAPAPAAPPAYAPPTSPPTAAAPPASAPPAATAPPVSAPPADAPPTAPPTAAAPPVSAPPAYAPPTAPPTATAPPVSAPPVAPKTEQPAPTMLTAPLPPAAAARAEGMKARIAAKHADPVVEKKKEETPTFEETTEFGYAIASTEEADPNEAIHGAHNMARAGKYREDIVEHLVASGVTPDEADYVAAMTGARRRPVADDGTDKKKRGRKGGRKNRSAAGTSMPIGAIVLAFVCIAGGLALAYFSYDAWQDGSERVGRRSPLGGLIAAGSLVLYGMRTMIGQRAAA